MSRFIDCSPFSRKAKDGSKASQRNLSFTPGHFVSAVRKGKGSSVDKMINEMIGKGFCVMDWIQANIPDQYLGYEIDAHGVGHGSILHQVPAIEDDEPNRHFFGMSYSRSFFFNTVTAANEELMQYAIEEDAVDLLPGSGSGTQNIRQLAVLLEEFADRDLSVYDYCEDTMVPTGFMPSPLYVLMFDIQDGVDDLLHAIRTDKLVDLMWSIYLALVASPIPHVSACADVLMEVPILRRHMTQLYAVNADASVSSFVNALPAVDLSTIAPDMMTCSFCWVDFDEPPSEEVDNSNTPVVAPCGNAIPHLFGRSCLAAIMKSTSEPLCPICRAPLDFPREDMELT